MKRLALLALLLTACSPPAPKDPAFVASLKEFDAEYERVARDTPATLRALVEPTSRDMRGRTIDDDIAQWVFSARTRGNIRSARQEAEDKGGKEANDAYIRASNLVNAEVLRAAQIQHYWTWQLPAPFWRRYWQAFFEANGIPVPAPDPRLTAAEQPIRAALETGDFARAVSLEPGLIAALRDSITDVTSRLNKERRTAKTEFAPRKTPCGKPAPASAWQTRASYVGGESIESFYPPSAIKRGEEGGTVLRMRIDRTGCATAAAVVVHSGVPALDAAALQWFEASQFSPASPNGAPIDSEMVLKVRFEIEDSPDAE